MHKSDYCMGLVTAPAIRDAIEIDGVTPINSASRDTPLFHDYVCQNKSDYIGS